MGEEFETRPLTLLGSQIKQSILAQIQSEIKGLHTKKKKGKKVGRLKFKSFVGSIPLKQCGITYKIVPNGRLTIQKLKHKFRIRGLKQIPPHAEFANARLLKKGDDYYLHLTCFLDKKEMLEERKRKREEANFLPHEALAPDLGIAHQVSLSNGLKISYRVPLTPSLKKAAKQVSRTQKGSKNRIKARKRLQKAYRKTTNIKKDIINKIVALMCLFAKELYYQNDYVKGWQRIWGCRLLETSLGRMLSKLRKLPGSKEVSRWYASSQECCRCLAKTKHPLSSRTFVCGKCGYQADRDIHAARNISRVGQDKKQGVQVGRLEPPHETPADMNTAMKMYERLCAIPYVDVSVVIETGSLGVETSTS